MEKDKKYIEFLKNRWISSCTEPQFYFHGKHNFTFLKKGTSGIRRIPEKQMD